jgi:hypothetical protein
MKMSPIIRGLEIYKDDENVKTGNVGATHYEVLYCNQQTDQFFGVNLSNLSSNSDELKKSDYQLLRPRNLQEIKI